MQCWSDEAKDNLLLSASVSQAITGMGSKVESDPKAEPEAKHRKPVTDIYRGIEGKCKRCARTLDIEYVVAGEKGWSVWRVLP